VGGRELGLDFTARSDACARTYFADADVDDDASVDDMTVGGIAARRERSGRARQDEGDDMADDMAARRARLLGF
jgi:hypothetical protein